MLPTNNNQNGESSGPVDEMEQMSTWMKEMNLPKKLQQKLLDEEVTIDVLLISDENDIRGLCKEFGLNRLSTMKLLAAVKKLPDARMNQKSKIIIMDLQEKDAMNQTESALSTLQNSLKTAQSSSDILQQNAANTEQQIRDAFQEVKKRVEEREQALMLRVIEVRDRQTQDLKDDVVRFEKNIDSVKNAIKLQHALFDQSLTADARKQKVLEYRDAAIDPNCNYELTENQELVFSNIHEQDLFQFIVQYGFVDGCFKARLPIITAVNIVQNNSIELIWKMTKCDAAVSEYEIQHTLNPDASNKEWQICKYKPTKEDINSCRFVIKCLKYSSDYCIRIRGSNQYGNGPFCATSKTSTHEEPVPNEPVWCEDFPRLDGNTNVKLQWKVVFDDEPEMKETKEDDEDDDERKENELDTNNNNNNNNDVVKRNDDYKVERYSQDCEVVKFEIQYAKTSENQWKTVIVDQLVDSGNQLCEHRFEKLDETTEFKFRIRCKNKVEKWSVWGAQSKVTTLLGITNHVINWDEINPSPPAPIRITNNGKHVEAPDASCWETFIGSSVGMSSGKHVWKMRWLKFGGSYQAMAIVTNVRCVDVRETNHRFSNNTTKYGQAYYWHRDGRKIAYGLDGNETDLKTSIDKFQVGEIVTISLDLDENTIRFDRGTTEVGTFDVKPGLTWHPMVLMCTCGNEMESVELTDW